MANVLEFYCFFFSLWWVGIGGLKMVDWKWRIENGGRKWWME
jgi:hypothetical protein